MAHFMRLKSLLPLVTLGIVGLFNEAPLGAASSLGECSGRFGSLQGELSPVELEAGFKKVLGYRPTRSHSAIFVVHGKIYRANQELGSGASQVWRGTDPNGQTVVMKKLFDHRSGWLQQYETWVTEYYSRHGVSAPRVLTSDQDQSLLIKEYFEGVTDEELKYHFKLLVGSKKGLGEALNSLNQERRRIEKIHQGFREWLRTAHPEASEEFYAQARWQIDHGDLKDENFIFDPRQRRWLLIDP